MLHDERSGLLIALAGFALLSCGDAIIKTMAGMWSPIAIAALRFTIGAVGLAVILRVRQGRAAFRPAKPWLQAARGLCLAMASMGFFTAIFFMPLAEATALVFIAPVLVAILSGPILGEKVPPATWAASVIAFAGVLLVLRPNLLAVGWVALLPVASAIFMSLLMIANRAVSRQGSPLSMQLFMAAFAAPILIVSAGAAAATGADSLAITVPHWSVVARCTLVAVTASTAHYMIYLGTMRAGASTIAPMTYVQLLVAVLLGWLLFGDTIDLVTLAGSAVIIGSGLYLIYTGRAPKAGELPSPD